MELDQAVEQAFVEAMLRPSFSYMGQDEHGSPRFGSAPSPFSQAASAWFAKHRERVEEMISTAVERLVADEDAMAEILSGVLQKFLTKGLEVKPNNYGGSQRTDENLHRAITGQVSEALGRTMADDETLRGIAADKVRGLDLTQFDIRVVLEPK